MSQPFSDHFSSHRAAAVEAAAAALCAAGFSSLSERRWKGVSPKGHAIEIELPPPFPDQLPEVFRAGERNGHIAHVERSGKLCIAPSSGTLLDTARPADIVQEAIERADVILGADWAAQQSEIEREFESYWAEEHDGKIFSTCPPRSATGPVWLVELDPKPTFTLVASDSTTAWDWARATGKEVLGQREAFFVRLDRPLVPPPFHKHTSLWEFLSLVEAASSADTVRAVKEWLLKAAPPATLLISAPLRGGGDVMVAVCVPLLRKGIAAKAQHGFRPGKVPPKLLLARAMSERVHRLEVSRADPEFILPRGGAAIDLRTKTIAIVGCGSVGSFTASGLAASGVGHLVLVDAQTLRTENTHRHVLGAAQVGLHKVTGLGQVLRARLPHLRITEVASTVEQSLDKADSPVLGADLVVFALGEETLELQLNEFLRNGPRRIHVWLDPLGVGGHILRVGSATCSGCFACLMRSDPEHGLANMASLVAPNQNFQRSLAGCAGTFTPFGAIDAERAGIEATREVIKCITASPPEALLTTWVASKRAITDAGYRLSPRSQFLSDDTLTRHHEVARSDCPICSGGTP